MCHSVLSSSLFLLCVLACVRGDLRSSVYGLMEARSGVQSNCIVWTSYFAPNAIVRSPVGSTPAVGTDAIQKHCESWNKKLGPQGNGWYPLELWSGNNEVAFQATVRAVNSGNCQVNLRGIIVLKFNPQGNVTEWNHYYDDDFIQPQLSGKCQFQ